MKKYLFLLFSISTIVLKAQFYQNTFETPTGAIKLPITIISNTNNIWQIGKPQKTIFNKAATLPRVIVTDSLSYYPINNISQFIITFFNLNYLGSPFPTAFQWKQKLDMDSKKDGGIVEFSTNSGVTWENAHNNSNVYQFYGFIPNNKDTINGNEFCFSGMDTVWRDVWLCLAPPVTQQNDTILLRFTFKSDSINTYKEGWMLDNFNAHGTIVHPVKEISQIDHLVVYPNITSGIVNVEMKKASETDFIENIDLYNNDGKLIEQYGKNYTKVVLDISKYKTGIYYLKVTINKQTTTHKIVYEKH